MGDLFAASSISSGLVLAALWLGRNWILTRLRADIKLENDSKLEDIKAQLTRTNDSLNNLSAAGGLAYSQSQQATIPHKIKAIEAVWRSVLAWNEMSAAATVVALLSTEWVEQHGSDPSTKTTFEGFLKSPGHLEFMKQRNETEWVRPFTSERVWALYSAYNGIYLSRIGKAAVLLIPDFDHGEFWQRVNERELVETAAPKEIVERYDANIIEGTTAFLAYLKDELLKEFKLELSGDRDSETALANAVAVLRASDKLVGSLKTSPTRPEV